MKYSFFILVITLIASCSGAQKLIEKKIDDGGKLTVKKDFF
jgi:hypothetical protein